MINTTTTTDPYRPTVALAAPAMSRTARLRGESGEQHGEGVLARRRDGRLTSRVTETAASDRPLVPRVV